MMGVEMENKKAFVLPGIWNVDNQYLIKNNIYYSTDL